MKVRVGSIKTDVPARKTCPHDEARARRREFLRVAPDLVSMPRGIASDGSLVVASFINGRFVGNVALPPIRIKD
jgi:hypothetical protein